MLAHRLNVCWLFLTQSLIFADVRHCTTLFNTCWHFSDTLQRHCLNLHVCHFLRNCQNTAKPVGSGSPDVRTLRNNANHHPDRQNTLSSKRAGHRNTRCKLQPRLPRHRKTPKFKCKWTPDCHTTANACIDDAKVAKTLQNARKPASHKARPRSAWEHAPQITRTRQSERSLRPRLPEHRDVPLQTKRRLPEDITAAQIARTMQTAREPAPQTEIPISNQAPMRHQRKALVPRCRLIPASHQDAMRHERKVQAPDVSEQTNINSRPNATPAQNVGSRFELQLQY